MNRPQLVHYINDSRDPSVVLAEATVQELEQLVDALYRNLDTPEPEFGAQVWYELASEELERRSAPTAPDAYGAA
jgi:hypothetical protein